MVLLGILVLGSRDLGGQKMRGWIALQPSGKDLLSLRSGFKSQLSHSVVGDLEGMASPL